MKTTERRAIVDLFKDLCSNTTDTLMISHLLYSNEILTSAEFDQIKAKASPYLKNEQLYAFLLTKSGNNDMEYLLQALRETFNHNLATRLESEIAPKQAPALAETKTVAQVDLSKVLRPILSTLCERTVNIPDLALELVTAEYISTSTKEEIEHKVTHVQSAYTLYNVIMKKSIPIEKLYDFLNKTNNQDIVKCIEDQLALQK